MNGLTRLCLAAAVGLSISLHAFGWGSVTGPHGGTAAMGPRGAGYAQGPNGGTAYRGPRGAGAAYGPTAGPPTAVHGVPVPRMARMAPPRTAAPMVELLRPVPMVGLHTGRRTLAVPFTGLAPSMLAR